jgi:type VI secretion system secreted protein Hcp
MASKYLYIQGIPGESTSYPIAGAGRNDGLIEIASLSYDVSQMATQSSGSGLVAGGASLSHISFSKEMDKSTPLLFYKLCAGETIDEVTFVFVRAGAAGQVNIDPPTPVGQKHPVPPNPNMSKGNYVYLMVVCRDVLVTSYHTSGAYGPGNRPLENISMSVAMLTEDYVDVDSKGMKKANVHDGYNFMSNSKI